MTLPCGTQQRLHNSFDKNTQGEVCIRTCAEITNSSITTAPDGISGPFRITTATITDAATLIPSVALINRKSFSISNLSEVETLYLGPTSSVTADRVDGILSGWEIGPNETINLPFRDSIVVYGITETGKTAQIKIFEVA